MQTTLLPNGRIQAQDSAGFLYDVGPENPDYSRVLAQCLPPTAKPDYTRVRLFGLLLMVVGITAWWYNWHTAAAEGTFSLRLTMLGPAGLFGGLLLLLRPDWSGKMHAGTSAAQKISSIAVMGLILAASGLDFYLMKFDPLKILAARRGDQPQATRPSRRASFEPMPSEPQTTSMPWLVLDGDHYEVKSFRTSPNPVWEFGLAGESIDNWSKLVTLIERADAHTPADLDRLAEGIQSTYKSHAAQILLAKTFTDDPLERTPYDYLVAMFDEPAHSRTEVNFVKVYLHGANAIVKVHSVRISGPQYQANTKTYLATTARTMRAAMNAGLTPELSRLARKEF